MATGATGTPTAKGLPTINPNADSPDGSGITSLAQAVDTLADKCQYTTDTPASGELPVWNGSAWVYSKIDPANILQDGAGSGDVLAWNGSQWTPTASSSGITRGTSLPGSPSDGDQYLLVDSTTAPTYSWLFRYSTAPSGSYKWECIGGSPKVVLQTTNNSGTTSSTYVSPTNNVTFTIPNAGDWLITIGFSGGNLGSNNSAGYYWFSYDVGATAASDEWGVSGVLRESTGDRPSGSDKTWLHSGVSASSAVTGKYRRSAGDSTGSTVDSLVLRVMPVRVA